MSVGIVAKRDDSVIGDEDGAALSGHRQEDPSNRFLLSVGPSHASDATVYMEHAISTASNNRSQSVADKLSDKNDAMLVHFGATSLVDSVSTRDAAMSVVQERRWYASLADSRL